MIPVILRLSIDSILTYGVRMSVLSFLSDMNIRVCVCPHCCCCGTKVYLQTNNRVVVVKF